MKGVGDFKGRVPRAAFGDNDDLTRRGPIPLTVRRPKGTPTPVEFSMDFPVAASEDVDINNTPAPRSFGELAMNMNMNPRPPSPSRSYPIRPTPTFSFSDGPEQAPLWNAPQPPPRQRRRSGPGFFSVLFLMVVAGLGGYMTVRYRAWQDLGPLVARLTELGRSLRTLAPSAAPEATSPAPTPAAPQAAPGAVPGVPTVPPAPQALRPEVVPIEPPRAASPTDADRTGHRSSRHHRRSLKPLSAEAAAEEAALTEPSGQR